MLGDGIAGTLERAATRKRLAERDLVGVLEIRAHRQATRETGDGDVLVERVPQSFEDLLRKLG